MFSIDDGWNSTNKQDDLAVKLFGSTKTGINPFVSDKKSKKKEKRKLKSRKKDVEIIVKDEKHDIHNKNATNDISKGSELSEKCTTNGIAKKKKKKKRKKEVEQANDTDASTLEPLKKKKKEVKIKIENIDNGFVVNCTEDTSNVSGSRNDASEKKEKKNKKHGIESETETRDKKDVKEESNDSTDNPTRDNSKNNIETKKKKKKLKSKIEGHNNQDESVEKLELDNEKVDNDGLKDNNDGDTVNNLNSGRERKRKRNKKKIPKTENEAENQETVEKNEHNDGVNMGHVEADTTPNKPSDDRVTKKLSKFQEKMSRKLEGGHFRWINEKLYTTDSTLAKDMFQRQPRLFDVYHKGFESQVVHWPKNPVDHMVEYLSSKPSNLVVADFGCGNAKLARSVPNKVHSFDLVAVNEHVTVSDMKKVPLSKGAVDVAVFSLALMGTNISDFISEANRVLKKEGILKIAEVKSRFVDVDKFVEGVVSHGFQLISKNDSNKMFILFEFEKTSEAGKQKSSISLKPCIYKRR